MRELVVLTAKYAVAVVPLLVLWVWWRAPRELRWRLVLRGAVVLVLSVALAKAGGALYHEPRPFVSEHIAPLIPHVADNGFPSDHVLLAFASDLLLIPFSWPAAGVGAALAAAIGLARVACHLHSVLDITASALFAAVANFFAALAIGARRRVRTGRVSS